MQRFQRGAHLRVRRRIGYWHHGIYDNDTRVIQFGGRVSDKRQANIQGVTLQVFENGSVAKVVNHPRLLGPWGSEPDSPDVILGRAEWLLANHPASRYNVIGWNCEHVANSCVNRWTESSQVLSTLGLHFLLGIPFTLYNARRNSSGRQYTRRDAFIVFAVFVLGLVIQIGYNFGRTRFGDEIASQCPI
jgi:hypothetical protein